MTNATPLTTLFHQPTPEPMATLSPPVPVAPVSGAQTDGYATTFEWEPVSDAKNFRIELADTETFDGDTFSAEVQNTHALTLYEMLPSDGRKYFWRVQANRGGGWTDWSAPQWFISATEAVLAAAPSVAPAAALAGGGTLAGATEPVATGGSINYSGFLWGWLIVVVVVTVFLLVVIL